MVINHAKVRIITRKSKNATRPPFVHQTAHSVDKQNLKPNFVHQTDPFRGQTEPQTKLCPPNRPFRGQTEPQTTLCPPNRPFRGQTEPQTKLCPPNRPFRGQTEPQTTLCPPNRPPTVKAPPAECTISSGYRTGGHGRLDQRATQPSRLLPNSLTELIGTHVHHTKLPETKSRAIFLQVFNLLNRQIGRLSNHINSNTKRL